MDKLIQGFGGGGGGSKGGAAAPGGIQEQPDSLRSKQFAVILDLVSEGEIGGLVDGFKSVFLNNVPVMNSDNTLNFENVVLTTRNGTQIQEYIPGFPAVESEYSVGVEVLYGIPITRTVTNSLINSVLVTVSVPQLTSIGYQNSLDGSRVELSIGVQSNGGGFVAQSIGTTWNSAPIGAPFGSGAQSYTALQVEGIGANVRAGHLEPGQFIEFRVEYKAVTDSIWIPIDTYTFTNADAGTPPGNNYIGDGELKSFFSPETLPLGDYIIRIILVSTNAPGVNPPFRISTGLSKTDKYSDVITGKTTSKYQRSYLIPLKGSPPWDIRVNRITTDAPNINTQNKTFWDSYKEIIDVKLSYPNSAVCGIVIDASQFGAVPNRGYEIKGIKVQIPSNYNPNTRVYTGPWDGTFKVAWSDNPAWCYYDMLTNSRYGLGDFLNVDQVDKWALYTIGQYCDNLVPDGFGKFEPRFTCNLYLQTQADAYRVISNFASIFRAISWWGIGTVITSQDSPADPVAQFTSSNVIGGEFSYSGSSRTARHTVVLVGWNDPEEAYSQQVEYVEDYLGVTRYGVIQTEIVAMGCTSRGQAQRLGRWLLYSERLETEVVTFQVGLDGAFAYPGAIIQTVDPFRSGKRFGGRIQSSTINTITIDAPIDIEAAKTYTVICQLPNGAVVEKTVINSPGITSIIRVSENFTDIPQAQSTWLISASDLSPETWKIVSITEVSKGIIEINALEHNVNKFIAVEQDVVLPARTVTSIRSVPDPVTNVTVTESLYISGPGVLSTRAQISWIGNTTASEYILKYKAANENWIVVRLRETSYEALSLSEAIYTFQINAINPLGIQSPATTLVQEIFGKQIPPTNPVSLIAAQNGALAVFRVPRSADLDFSVFEFRYGPRGLTDWNSMTPITDNFGRKVTLGSGDTSLTTADLPPGDHTIAVKAVDTTGNYSALAAYDDLNFISAYDVIVEKPQAVDWLGTKVNFVHHQVSNTLIPDSTLAANAHTNAQLFEQFVPFPQAICTYEAPEIDIVIDNNVRIWANITSELGRGVLTGIANPHLEIDFRTMAGAYDGFETWSIGNRVMRYLKAKLILDTAIGRARIIQFIPVADLLERDEEGTNVTFLSTGTPIVFSTPFHRIPHMQVTPLGSATATAGADVVTTTGFTGYRFPTGQVNWKATGV